MSAFDKRVRARAVTIRRDQRATAEAIALSNTLAELVDRAAFATVAYEIAEQLARDAHAERTERQRRQVAQGAAALGAPVDEHGNVRRLDAKRAIRRAQTAPAKAREGASEPRRAPSGIIVPRPGDLAATERAADFERGQVRR